jgi:hypothetical protein
LTRNTPHRLAPTEDKPFAATAVCGQNRPPGPLKDSHAFFIKHGYAPTPDTIA